MTKQPNDTPADRETPAPTTSSPARGGSASTAGPAAAPDTAAKPSGPMTYTVSSGADVWPSWRRRGF